MARDPRPTVYLELGKERKSIRLTGVDALAFAVVWQYYLERGKQCFTYSSILRFYEYYCRREGLEYKPQTFERRLRKLREHGVLYSFKGRLGTVFCLQPSLEIVSGLRVTQGVVSGG